MFDVRRRDKAPPRAPANSPARKGIGAVSRLPIVVSAEVAHAPMVCAACGAAILNLVFSLFYSVCATEPCSLGGCEAISLLVFLARFLARAATAISSMVLTTTGIGLPKRFT